MSLFWDHKNKMRENQRQEQARAALAAQDKEKGKSLVTANEAFQLLVASLEKDLERIKALPKGELRTALKRDELLPLYMKHVNAYLAGKEVYKNPLLVQCMIWLFDVGDIDTALRVAAVAIAQSQAMPERFKRDVRTFVADAILEWTKIQKIQKGAIEPYFSAVYSDVIDWPVHDEIKAQYHRYAAEELELEKPAEALEKYREALRLDHKLKVKTTMAKLEKALEAS